MGHLAYKAYCDAEILDRYVHLRTHKSVSNIHLDMKYLSLVELHQGYWTMNSFDTCVIDRLIRMKEVIVYAIPITRRTCRAHQQTDILSKS